MAFFQIPEMFLPGFKALGNLDGIQFEKLKEIAGALPVGIGPNTFQQAFANSNLPGWRHIAVTLFSLGSLLASRKEDGLVNLAEELYDSYRSTEDNQEAADNLKERLSDLFRSCKNLRTTFKAFNLLTENERVFREARIITDVRPVFHDVLDADNRPALLLHQLKLSYQQDGDPYDDYVCLDSKDLIKLKEHLDRAIEKETHLRSSYGSIIDFINITD